MKRFISFKKLNENNKGFTLIELVVVTAIISIMSVLTVVNYQTGEKQFALKGSAHKLAQDLRRVEEKAMSAEEFGGTIPKGYGVLFNISEPRHYILFADQDGDDIYDGSPELVEDIGMEAGVKIDRLFSELCPLCSYSLMYIIFSPPDPSVEIKAGLPWESISKGIINLSTDIQAKTVKVNQVGLIEID